MLLYGKPAKSLNRGLLVLSFLEILDENGQVYSRDISTQLEGQTTHASGKIRAEPKRKKHKP